MNNIVVIGSINVDMITKTAKLPKIGETVIGDSFLILPGGKGINQAMSALEVNDSVYMVGCIGDDSNGAYILDYYSKTNLNIEKIEVIKGSSTGIANITIQNNDNTIIVVSGANYKVSKEIINKNKELILNASIVVMQCEIRYEVIEYVIDLCYKNGVKVLLDPAPALKLDENLIEKITYLTPNLLECIEVFDNDDIEGLLVKYPNKLIITCGKDGVMYHDGNIIKKIASHKVNVVDTTGAGDAFSGAFAGSISNGKSIKDSIDIAISHATDCVLRIGAQKSIK